jgi:hypothetical protein
MIANVETVVIVIAVTPSGGNPGIPEGAGCYDNKSSRRGSIPTSYFII